MNTFVNAALTSGPLTGATSGGNDYQNLQSLLTVGNEDKLKRWSYRPVCAMRDTNLSPYVALGRARTPLWFRGITFSMGGSAAAAAQSMTLRAAKFATRWNHVGNISTVSHALLIPDTVIVPFDFPANVLSTNIGALAEMVMPGEYWEAWIESDTIGLELRQQFTLHFYELHRAP